jgi:hypothetical protein
MSEDSVAGLLDELKKKGVELVWKNGRLGYRPPGALSPEEEAFLREVWEQVRERCDVKFALALLERGILTLAIPPEALKPGLPFKPRRSCVVCGWNVFWKQPKEAGGTWQCARCRPWPRGVRPEGIVVVDYERVWREEEKERRRVERTRRHQRRLIEQLPIVGAQNLSADQQKRVRGAMHVIRILASFTGGISVGQAIAALKSHEDDVIVAAIRTLEKAGLLLRTSNGYFRWCTSGRQKPSPTCGPVAP